jgi:Lon protease-like protein
VSASEELPLFPLNTVLFPGGPLPLRIFEPRYLDLVRRCLKGESQFGVVLILAGEEAGAVAEIAATGTSARVVDFDTLPDGLLGITCVGERRFRVNRLRKQGDGLNVAAVEYLPDAPARALPAELAHLSDLLRQVLPQLGGGYDRIDSNYQDAGWVGNRWAEILPLTPAEKLTLLALDDPLARLEQVAAWSDRQPAAADE